MSTRCKITAALREGQRRGLKGRALETHVNQMAEVRRMTSAEIAVASKAYREMVYPLTRPPKSVQGQLDLEGQKVNRRQEALATVPLATAEADTSAVTF